MTLDEMIEVMQAFKEGGLIECRRNPHSSETVWEFVKTPIWNFFQFDYRVKPKPKDYWLNVYEMKKNGLLSFGDLCPNRKEALINRAQQCSTVRAIKLLHLREVLDDNDEGGES